MQKSLLVFLLVFLVNQVFATTLILNDGTTIKGDIFVEEADAIVIATKEGMKYIGKSEIKKKFYTDYSVLNEEVKTSGVDPIVDTPKEELVSVKKEEPVVVASEPKESSAPKETKVKTKESLYFKGFMEGALASHIRSHMTLTSGEEVKVDKLIGYGLGIGFPVDEDMAIELSGALLEGKTNYNISNGDFRFRTIRLTGTVIYDFFKIGDIGLYLGGGLDYFLSPQHVIESPLIDVTTSYDNSLGFHGLVGVKTRMKNIFAKEELDLYLNVKSSLAQFQFSETDVNGSKYNTALFSDWETIDFNTIFIEFGALMHF